MWLWSRGRGDVQELRVDRRVDGGPGTGGEESGVVPCTDGRPSLSRDSEGPSVYTVSLKEGWINFTRLYNAQ